MLKNKKKQQIKWEANAESTLVRKALHDELSFRPAPPQDELPDKRNGLSLATQTIEIDGSQKELTDLIKGLEQGALTKTEVTKIIKEIKLPSPISKKLLDATREVFSRSGIGLMQLSHEQDALALLAINIISRIHESLLHVEPLTEIRFHLTDTAKAVLAIGWTSLVKRGVFPYPPSGNERMNALNKNPIGAMHFVSASDLDAGYHYTMGIAFSPEAQSLGSMNVSYGLDGELIVPGQAVSPIPPFLALGTRLFSAGIATSSNISEEIQTIPMRNYPHPTAERDLEPKRGGIYYPTGRFDTLDQLLNDLKQQLWKATRNTTKSSADHTKNNERFKHPSAFDVTLPPVKVVFEVTEMTPNKIYYYLNQILKDKELLAAKDGLALYLNIESTSKNRIERINEIVDIAAAFKLKYVAVADNEKDEWLPNLLEYLEPYELNAVADYSDRKGVMVIDGRPIDPIYTAATSAQRIQSVYTTLAVDVLKMGMWLCLDALSARIVYRELLNNPHIPLHMLLMPIGIIEPWNAFVDNRNPKKTPRAIIDPFEKIKFMIEEAEELGMPSLLTDTRHKEVWVLLGRKTDQDDPHPREDFIREPSTNKIVSRTDKSAIPLLSWDEFMACERLAREAGIFLGQAGSVETTQLFKIISETTYDAAKEGKNPATAIWTAETERVLSTGTKVPGVELQSLRSATVSPFLAVINRGFESHAKLDGWLRYLADKRESDATNLRQKLEEKRLIVNKLLQQLIIAQSAWRKNNSAESQANYQKAWDEFSKTYLTYHRLIVENFLQVRDLVAKHWGFPTKAKERSYELEEG